jgi:predicted acetyltransferase
MGLPPPGYNSPMEIRNLSADDVSAHNELLSEAFARGRREAADQAELDNLKELDKCNRFGVVVGPRLVAAATILNIPVFWNSSITSMGGIAAVACAADHRGQGHVGRLLQRSLIYMKEAGQFLSGLNPFAYAFYRRHGWEWVGEKRVSTLPLSLLPPNREATNVTMYQGLDAKPVVATVYDTVARQYRGMVVRDQILFPDFWKRCLDHADGRTTYVHVYRAPDTGKPEGYFKFGFPETGDKLEIPELFATTPRAYGGLLGVLHNYGTQLKTVEVTRPADDALGMTVMHWDVEQKVKPLFMARIVDIASAFEAVAVPKALDGNVVLSIQDDQCDWNNGVFSIVVEGGTVTVRRSTATADVVLDIQALTQAYWGWPPLNALRNAGRVEVKDEAGYSLLAAILPEARSYIGDFF